MDKGHDTGYRRLISSTVIFILAVILVIVGVFLLSTGLTVKDPTIKLVYILTGASFIIISLSFFVIANMADDLHKLSYEAERHGEESSYYYNESLQMMENIEKLLQLQHYQQQNSKSGKKKQYTRSMEEDDLQSQFERFRKQYQISYPAGHSGRVFLYSF